MTARPDASQGALVDLGARRLEDRVKEVLRDARVPFEARSLSFAVDFVRLSIRALSLNTLGDAERRILASAVRARAGLDDEAIRILLDLALAPQFRSSMSALDLQAFEVRFGEEAAELLREEEREELDLRGFGARHGSGGALLLVDSMFAVSAARGEITAKGLMHLRRAADELGVDEVLVSALLQKHDPRLATGDLRFPLRGRDRVVIGRATGCDVTLADPQVAMRHAELLRVEGSWRIVDLGSGRPTVVNGVPVSSAPIDSSTRVRMGPWSLRLAKDDAGSDVLQAFGERSFSALSVRQVSRQVDGRSLLDDVSFTVFSGEVVALVGPSGAGKTTLLNAISGVMPADSGEVLLDGQDFHQLLGLDRSLVGIVPQDDLVHPELTVEESLLYSGRIRFASDVTREEIQAEVARVLDELGIAHIAENRIGDALRRGISGGQRKRVNLGQELMTRSTRLLLLDEPTSGLDPRAAQDIVRLVRQLADVGRIVFLVTHDLSPQVMAQVDHVLVLAPGGRLAYFGPPSEACAYFAVPTPDAIFDRFPEHSGEEWGRRYRESTDLRKYVTTREYLLGLDGLRQASRIRAAPPRRSRLAELRTLVSRYARVKLRDRNGLFVFAVQPAVLGLVMWIVFPAPTSGMIFMLSLCALWFGMSSAVRELIADRVIWRREHRVGVGVAPYLLSKVLVLGLVTALQAFGLTALVWALMGLGGYGFSLGLMGAVSVLTAWVGMALGLLVSAAWSSSEAAVGTLPLLLIPQITFSAILVSLTDMGTLARAVTWVTVERFAFDALLKTGHYLDKPSKVPGQWDRRSISGPLYELGFKPPSADDFGLSLPLLAAIVAAFGVAFLAAASVLVWWREAREP